MPSKSGKQVRQARQQDRARDDTTPCRSSQAGETGVTDGNSRRTSSALSWHGAHRQCRDRECDDHNGNSYGLNVVRRTAATRLHAGIVATGTESTGNGALQVAVTTNSDVLFRRDTNRTAQTDHTGHTGHTTNVNLWDQSGLHSSQATADVRVAYPSLRIDQWLEAGTALSS